MKARGHESFNKESIVAGFNMFSPLLFLNPSRSRNKHRKKSEIPKARWPRGGTRWRTLPRDFATVSL